VFTKAAVRDFGFGVIVADIQFPHSFPHKMGEYPGTHKTASEERRPLKPYLKSYN
jgi:hypothetical protein